MISVMKEIRSKLWTLRSAVKHHSQPLIIISTASTIWYQIKFNMEMDDKNNATKNYFLHANFYSKPRLIKKSSPSMATFEKESKLAITLDLYGGIIFLVLSYRSTKLFLKILIFALFSYSFSSKNPLKS